MEIDEKNLSPMMQKYLETKRSYKDCILFYRLGDFYEMFFEDAKIASKELELTLTSRPCGNKERAPMCGVPYHAVDSYISRLVKKGYKVSVCEQIKDDVTDEVIERKITKIFGFFSYFYTKTEPLQAPFHKNIILQLIPVHLHIEKPWSLRYPRKTQQCQTSRGYLLR